MPMTGTTKVKDKEKTPTRRWVDEIFGEQSEESNKPMKDKETGESTNRKRQWERESAQKEKSHEGVGEKIWNREDQLQDVHNEEDSQNDKEVDSKRENKCDGDDEDKPPDPSYTIDEEGKGRREEDDEEDIQENINAVSKDGDLSPRHTKELRTSRKIYKVIGRGRSTMSSSAKPPLSK
ncbi:uncharacterized protein LOC125823461 [Solanum verrucosum]|uniref:uncharacterized protein LOC125823461 n=1 Tax=Solanum verrucosum TaxID=315347 RepID=UPI0020D1471B|nr:uncharacterized protein LOC125823461 [Solanum verrucosum]